MNQIILEFLKQCTNPHEPWTESSDVLKEIIISSYPKELMHSNNKNKALISLVRNREGSYGYKPILSSYLLPPQSVAMLCLFWTDRGQN